MSSASAGSSSASYLEVATETALAAGAHMKAHFGEPLVVDDMQSHDIKLALDVECQELITERLLAAYPGHAIYGEEGIAGDQASPFQWIVDPIDGTVNFWYGIPHFCTTIALREAGEIIAGVIYDPMRDELWQIEKGGRPLLNGKEIKASTRGNLADCIATVGLSKSLEAIKTGLPIYSDLAAKVRKMRMMGSAALEMAYLATGRLDIYFERSISLWDIAAGQLLLEAAGGRVRLEPSPLFPDKYSILAWNGAIDEELLPRNAPL
jgi:myo-inositol-1(or 4)-monophosphatase